MKNKEVRSDPKPGGISAITNAIRNGASPMQVQAMARHASFDTILGYYYEVNRIDNPAEGFIILQDLE